MKNILTMGRKSKLAFENLKRVSHSRINNTLNDYIKLILRNKKKIISENNKDVKNLKRTNVVQIHLIFIKKLLVKILFTFVKSK